MSVISIRSSTKGRACGAYNVVCAQDIVDEHLPESSEPCGTMCISKAPFTPSHRPFPQSHTSFSALAFRPALLYYCFHSLWRPTTHLLGSPGKERDWLFFFFPPLLSRTFRMMKVNHSSPKRPDPKARRSCCPPFPPFEHLG